MYDTGLFGGQSYLDWLAHHPYDSAAQRLRPLHQAAAALDDLHARGAAHGDVRPATIVVRPDGSTDLAELGPVSTTDGALAASRSPAYAAPELFLPGSVTSPAADRFAFAATVAHAVLGAPAPTGLLHQGPDLAQLAERLRFHPPTAAFPGFQQRIVSALAAPAATRPGPLAGWLAALIDDLAPPTLAHGPAVSAPPAPSVYQGQPAFPTPPGYQTAPAYQTPPGYQTAPAYQTPPGHQTVPAYQNPPTQPLPQWASQPGPERSRAGTWLLIGLVALLAVGCAVGGGWYLLGQAGDDRPTPGVVAAPSPSTVAAPSPDVVESSPAGDLARAREFLSGTWSGTYDCRQGRTGLQLTIYVVDETTVLATFEFSAVAANPGVPPGSFALAGTYTASSLTLRPDHWIKRPGDYEMVELAATFLPGSGQRLRGDVVTSGCDGFSVTKTSAETRKPA